jgi:BolA family transcriptional regulator, general stress-responsive regulator
VIVQTTIDEKLRAAFLPAHLTVLNESHMHSVPANSETHFKVVVVSEVFKGQRLIVRHQAVNATLADELAGPVHALSIQAHTPEEWLKRGGAILDSPNCHGGSKIDAAS